MTRTDIARTVSAVLAVAVLAAGCAGRAPTSRPARIDVTPPELSQAMRANLSRPGVYDLAGGLSLVVGTLHYRDLSGGYWAIDVRERYRGDEPTADLVLANASTLATDLQALDGQYVGAGVRLQHATYSDPAATRPVDVAWLGLVSDLAHASPTNRYGTGLYTLEDGSQYVGGWLERKGGRVVLYFTRPGTPGRAPSLTVEASAGVHPPLPAAGSYADMIGSVVGTSGGLPAFHVLQLRGWSVAGTGGGAFTITGVPPRWRHVEPPGLKDAPHGRERVVGVLSKRRDGLYAVGGVPWMPTPGETAAAVQSTSTVAARLEAALGTYVAVVGLQVGTAEVMHARLGLLKGSRVPLLVPESVTVVSTMTPSAEELVLLRGAEGF